MPSSYIPAAIATPVSPQNGGTGVANNSASTLTISGNFGTTITVGAATNVTLPSGSFTVAKAGTNSDITSLTACTSIVAAAAVTVGTTGTNNLVLQANGTAALTFNVAGGLCTLGAAYGYVITGNFYFPSGGTAGVPRLTVNGVDTGFYFSSAGADLGITTEGAARALFNASGMTVGVGIPVKNIRHGISAAMTLGAVTITDAGCTANTRYFFSAHQLGTISVPGGYYASTRNAGVSVVCSSSQPTETSTIDWLAIEP